MKKKTLFIMLMIALFICLFAISANAEEYAPAFGKMTEVKDMADKATFGDDGKFDTCTSRVLMNDGVTYPAYYILADQATMKLDFSKLNTNATKNYDRSSIVAFELCEGITHVASCYNNNGFQGDKFTPNIEYIKLPSTLIDLSSDAPFYSLSKLKVVDNFENTQVTTIPKRGFAGCPIEEMKFPSTLETIVAGSLNAFAGELDLSNTAIEAISDISFQNNTAIKGIKLPNGVTSIGKAAFNGCTSLSYVVAESGLTSVGQEAFRGCTSLKTIDFSKTQLETIGLRSFFDCHSLEVVNLGHIKKLETQSFYRAGINTDKSYVEYYISGALEEIYNQYGQIMQDAKMAVIYYTGTNSDTGFSLLHSNALKSGAANWYTVDAKSADFVAGATYTENTIVYNYDTCDAFYGGTHVLDEEKSNDCAEICENCGLVTPKANPVHNTTTIIAYENGFAAAGKKTVCCSNEGCPLNAEAKETSVDAIFAGFLYSTREEDGAKYGLVLTYSVNKDALTAYETAMNTTLTYGVLAIAEQNVKGNPLEKDGTPNVESIVATDVTGAPSVDIIIWGKADDWDTVINEETGETVKDIPFYILGYVIKGEELNYFYDTTSSKNLVELTTKSYNGAKA